MGLPKKFYCPALVVFFVFLAIQGASAWTVQSIAIKPSGGPLSPHTEVTASFTVHFDSWIDGETFDSGHTLDMYTELENAQWSATLVNSDPDGDRDPITTTLDSKKGIRYRVDGWTLNYDSTQLNLNVVLHGTAPGVTGTGEKVILKVQELDEMADEVSGAIKIVKYEVVAPATATTAPTPDPTSPARTSPIPTTTVPVTSSTVQQTYSPGTDPCMIICVLVVACIVMSAAVRKRNR